MNLIWHTPSDELPEILLLTSRTVLFEMEGAIYCGTYHMNGYFRIDEEHDKYNRALWAGASNPTLMNNNGIVYPLVTKWAYLRESI